MSSAPPQRHDEVPEAPRRLYTGVEPERRRRSSISFEGLRTWAKRLWGESLQHPNRFDWRELGVVPFPADQEDVAACVSYAACLSAAARHHKLTGRAISLAPRVMHLCTMELAPDNGTNLDLFEPALLEHGLPIVEGGTAGSVAAAMSDKGQCPLISGLPRLFVTGLKRLSTPEEVKHEVSTSGPIVATMALFTDFWDSYQAGSIYDSPGRTSHASHAFCLIGYDDTLGCWIGVNSKGAGWGDKGRFLLKYGACEVLGPGMPVYALLVRS